MRVIRGVGCLVIAAIMWVGSLHLWFERDPGAVLAPLTARQLALTARRG